MRRIAARSLPQCPAQRGQIVLGLLVILGLAFGLAFYTFVGPKGSTIERDKITAAALAQARDALIGRAVSDTNRPGSLPCPDTTNDGTSEGLSGNECPSYIGRLPWKTLGLSDLRDGNGERLWYAFSRNFRDDSTAQPINTDTKGSLTVYSNTTGTTLTSQAAAVIFAPGAAFGTQDRSSSTTMSCTAPSGTISRDRCAANYLETTSSTNNAVAAGPYIQAPATNTFNDRLLVITTDDLMTPVERRAANEIISLLQTYYTTYGYYPWPDISDGSSNWGYTYGRVPLENAASTESSWPWRTTPNWPVAVSPWLNNNEWWWVFFYTVASGATRTNPAGCNLATGTSCLNINNGASYARAILITTGPAGANRPMGSVGSWNDSWWSNYVDDSNNSDLGTWFITPTSTAYARDRLYTFP